jgi:hypothetical protein
MNGAQRYIDDVLNNRIAVCISMKLLRNTRLFSLAF